MDSGQIINPIRILIVDDHPNTASMLARVLNRFETPVEVITASGGDEAIQSIGERHVDILITDFMMPGVNGLELIERMKGERKPAYTILITAYDTPGLAITARKLHVQSYLVKPVQPEKIRSIVEKAVKDLRPEAFTMKTPGGQRGFRIVVADDNPDNLRLLSARLEHEGYIFLPAWDGEEALTKIRAEAPDLVLLDINMPKKDGFQVLREIREDPKLSQIPVIIVTAARIGPKDVRDGFALGADDYVIKPFDWRELGARIQAKLRIKLEMDELRERERVITLLLDTGQELRKTQTPVDLCEFLVNRMSQAFPTDHVQVDLFGDGKVNSFSKGKDDFRIMSKEWTSVEYRQKNLGQKALNSGTGMLIDRTRGESTRQTDTGVNTGSALVVPIAQGGRSLGVISLKNEAANHFTHEHLTLIKNLALYAWLALEKMAQCDQPVL